MDFLCCSFRTTWMNYDTGSCDSNGSKIESVGKFSFTETLILNVFSFHLSQVASSIYQLKRQSHCILMGRYSKVPPPHKALLRVSLPLVSPPWKLMKFHEVSSSPLVFSNGSVQLRRMHPGVFQKPRPCKPTRHGVFEDAYLCQIEIDIRHDAHQKEIMLVKV